MKLWIKLLNKLNKSSDSGWKNLNNFSNNLLTTALAPIQEALVLGISGIYQVYYTYIQSIYIKYLDGCLYLSIFEKLFERSIKINHRLDLQVFRFKFECE